MVKPWHAIDVWMVFGYLGKDAAEGPAFCLVSEPDAVDTCEEFLRDAKRNPLEW